MYTSGKFAGMFRVSKKLLRHYHDIGLLIPSAIDSANGYSYYDEISVKKMRSILYLRSLRIPLNEVKLLLEMPEKGWFDTIHGHLSHMRSEQRVVNRVEKELVSLEKKIINGKGVFDVAQKKTELLIRVFYLENPIFVTGRAVRVLYGSPEHNGPESKLSALVSDYFSDDVPSMIPDRKEPVMRFGICAEFAPATGEFTYMMGDQTLRQIKDEQLPATTRNYLIPAGHYACVTFSAPDIDSIIAKMLGEGFDQLFRWLGASDEWESSVHGVAYEVYDDERFEVPSWPEMDIWTPVKKKGEWK